MAGWTVDVVRCNHSFLISILKTYNPQTTANARPKPFPRPSRLGKHSFEFMEFLGSVQMLFTGFPLFTDKKIQDFPGPHEKLSRTFSEPTNV